MGGQLGEASEEVVGPHRPREWWPGGSEYSKPKAVLDQLELDQR